MASKLDKGYIFVFSNTLCVTWNVTETLCTFTIDYPLTFNQIYYINASNINSGRFSAIMTTTNSQCSGWISDNKTGIVYLMVIGV